MVFNDQRVIQLFVYYSLAINNHPVYHEGFLKKRITFFVSCVTSHDHMMKVWQDPVGGQLLSLAPTISSLMAVSVMDVMMYWLSLSRDFTWPQSQTVTLVGGNVRHKLLRSLAWVIHLGYKSRINQKNWLEVPTMGLKRQLHVGAISPKSINIWEFNSSSIYICDPSFLRNFHPDFKFQY